MKIKRHGHDPFARSSLEGVQRAAAQLLTDLNALPHLVEAFLLKSGTAQTRFGRDALNQADFVRLMRRGRKFKLDTVQSILAHIAGP